VKKYPKNDGIAGETRADGHKKRLIRPQACSSIPLQGGSLPLGRCSRYREDITAALDSLVAAGFPEGALGA
jgi:hypothetical protein